LLDGSERAARVAAVWWPFVHALRVDPPPNGTLAVTFPLVPRPTTRFLTSYGQDPDSYGPGVHMSIAVRERTGAETTLYAADSNPLRVPADRPWRDVDVDLAPWAGRPIELVLRTTGPTAVWPDAGYAGWGAPRLVE
jgi:hypothetical protein